MKCLEILRKNELHEYERPISMTMLQTAEMNRDAKKRRKPYDIEEFYLYSDGEQDKLPNPKYCAAAMALIKEGLLPAWALFVYKDLKDNANGYSPPELLAYICADVLLLAPEVDRNGCKAMLIAEKSASGAVREMTSPCGRRIRVAIPDFSGAFYAEEDVLLDVFS